MIDASVKEKEAIISTAQKCALPAPEYLSDVPIVAFSGFSESGKTTFIEKLIPELKRRGYRIVTIKQTHHEFASEPGKDSERHLSSGSEVSMVVSPTRLVLTRPVEEEVSIDEMVRVLGDDYDIIICEGFKYSDIPKLVVYRQGIGAFPLGLSNVIGVITDEELDIQTRQYSFEDVEAVADMLEEEIIIPHASRINISVNNTAVPLIEFPRSIISRTILGMLTALKGVGLIRYARISVGNGAFKDKGEA
jgi:molybdopterin-guanine dinucleotide biosynthesis protein B